MKGEGDSVDAGLLALAEENTLKAVFDPLTGRVYFPDEIDPQKGQKLKKYVKSLR